VVYFEVEVGSSTTEAGRWRPSAGVWSVAKGGMYT